MSIIASCQPTTARELSRILATDKNWVGRSAESLKRRGLVSGSPDRRDGRRTLLRLTDEGKRLHDSILVVALWRQNRLIGCLPEAAANILIDHLDRLQAEADRMLEESEPSQGGTPDWLPREAVTDPKE